MERTKRSEQFSKEYLEELIEKYDNDKGAIAKFLGIGTWSLREQLKRTGLNIDKRAQMNKERKIVLPPKEELERLYNIENKTLLEIGKIFNTSNVTVKKWFVEYGIELLSHSKTIQKKVVPKIREHNKRVYGVEDFFASDIGKEKVKTTFIEKYGVHYHPIGNTSMAELEVLDFLNSISPGFEKDVSMGIEIDGLNKEINVGFEYCGLYFHSEEKKGKLLHENKYKTCLNNSIKLFTIFEDEWKKREFQVKNFMRASLKKNEHKLFARNLIIEKVHGRNKEALTFLEDYHIQGTPSLLQLLCHYILKDEENNIYSVMSFSKHHRNNTEIVLSRYCVKGNYTIIGGAKKLFTHALNNFKCDIKTWSDNRWSSGELYDHLGFTLKTNLPKDYYYVYRKDRINKQKMTKDKIGAGPNQTEYERAKELGYDRIWDCGKKTWVYEYKN